MAALKNVFLSLSKSSELSQSLPLRPTVSRVCFAAASRHQQGRNMAGEAGRKEYTPYNDEEPRDEVRETMDKAKEKTQEMKDRAKESANETADSVKERAQQMNDKTKENLGSMADKAYEMREKTADAAGSVADKTKRQAHEATDKVKGAADKTKEYAQGAKEKVADAAKGAWGAAKETTQKIKETVVGKSDEDDLDDYIEDHVKKPAREHRGEKVMDEDVVDARRRRADEHDRGKL
ncbi:uncharacterized protein ECU03_1610 [Salvia hispanica]|uniref:uncharacterized protein ECU03_1610 n=1 Tax=Salvia hispanica TaxID=49212 RepID=UPI0020097179|nr:uncharacterized protein ECU03_1610 [Salvia hispanica]